MPVTGYIAKNRVKVKFHRIGLMCKFFMVQVQKLLNLTNLCHAHLWAALVTMKPFSLVPAPTVLWLISSRISQVTMPHFFAVKYSTTWYICIYTYTSIVSTRCWSHEVLHSTLLPIRHEMILRQVHLAPYQPCHTNQAVMLRCRLVLAGAHELQWFPVNAFRYNDNHSQVSQYVLYTPGWRSAGRRRLWTVMRRKMSEAVVMS